MTADERAAAVGAAPADELESALNRIKHCLGRDQPVAPGSVIFVERAVEHRFVDITEDLAVALVHANS